MGQAASRLARNSLAAALRASIPFLCPGGTPRPIMGILALWEQGQESEPGP
jgi:hypothetical protein